jgi:hypothetical protein
MIRSHRRDGDSGRACARVMLRRGSTSAMGVAQSAVLACLLYLQRRQQPTRTPRARS